MGDAYLLFSYVFNFDEYFSVGRKIRIFLQKGFQFKSELSLNMNNKSERIEKLLTYLPLPSLHVPFHLYYFETSNLFLSQLGWLYPFRLLNIEQELKLNYRKKSVRHKLKNVLKTQKNAFFACFRAYVGQPHNHILNYINALRINQSY